MAWTTAAALWSASAIGLAVGLGFELTAAALVLVTLVVLWPLDALSERLLENRAVEERTFHIVAGGWDGLAEAQRVLARSGAPTREMEVAPFGDTVSARLVVRCRRQVAERLITELRELRELEFVSDEAQLAADQ